MSKRSAWLLAAVVLIVAFIWGNSVLSRAASRQESRVVLVWVRPFLELFVGRGNVTLNLVRKLAHVTEFTVLGATLGALFARMRRWYLLSLALGAAVAAVDETIQLFSQRGSQLSDVGIDVCGVLLGILLCALFRALLRKKE